MSAPETPAALQAWIDRSPFHRWLGVVAEAVDPGAGRVTLRLPFRPGLGRSDAAPDLHGGAIAALIDIAGDYALALGLGGGVPTIDLRIDYLRMARSDLLATAEVVRAGRTVGRVDVRVEDAEGRLIALGRGTYATRRG